MIPEDLVMYYNYNYSTVTLYYELLQVQYQFKWIYYTSNIKHL